MNAIFVTLALALAQAPELTSAELKPATLGAFERYVKQAEARIERRNRNGNFLWVDDSAPRREQARAGAVPIESLAEKKAAKVPDGLVHDWIGAVFIPNTELQNVLASVQDYDRQKYVYKPEVIDSRLLARSGNDFKVFLQLRKKKLITVVLNTEHDARFFPLAKTRWWSRSYSTKIAEVSDGRELPPGQGHGFLWRLYSYWRFEERDGGVWVECEAISLTRDIPTGLGWLISPIVRDLPRESLENTLRATRAAVK